MKAGKWKITQKRERMRPTCWCYESYLQKVSRAFSPCLESPQRPWPTAPLRGIIKHWKVKEDKINSRSWEITAGTLQLEKSKYTILILTLSHTNFAPSGLIVFATPERNASAGTELKVPPTSPLLKIDSITLDTVMRSLWLDSYHFTWRAESQN